MSFEKAQRLIEVATFVSAHRMGVTIDDVQRRYGSSSGRHSDFCTRWNCNFPTRNAVSTKTAESAGGFRPEPYVICLHCRPMNSPRSTCP
jgi:hypothetical protein